jgi:hypothetical protein
MSRVDNPRFTFIAMLVVIAGLLFGLAYLAHTLADLLL